MVTLTVTGVSLLVPGQVLHIFGLKVAGIALLVSTIKVFIDKSKSEVPSLSPAAQPQI